MGCVFYITDYQKVVDPKQLNSWIKVPVGLNARLQYLQWVSNGDTAVLHGAIDMPSWNLVNIVSGNGLLPDGTKPLHETMLTYHQ